MLGLSAFATALAAGAAFFASPVAAAADPLVIKGNHFFYKSNGTEFYIKGVAYQQGVGGNRTTGNASFVDPLTDTAGCDRDIPLMTKLNTNTVRVYAIDPTKDHSHCMNALADAGIYLIADLSAPDESITSENPQWNIDLYKRYVSVVDALANYTNVIGFFAGNEVANNKTDADSLAFVKGAVRDMKAYIKQKNYRDLYVGYASADVPIRTDIENYLNCGPQAEDNIDFFGYNIYSWCGEQATFESSGYNVRTEELSNYTVPAFFAEYGCNNNGAAKRTFNETLALYGSQMTGVWSGGIVYEWFQEDNDYGLVTVAGTSASTLDDFNNLATQLASVSPTILNSASFTPTNTATRSCPSVGGDWSASPTLPPSPNQQLCDCMVASVSCVPKGNIADDKAGALFDYICGSQSGVSCDGISGNSTTGKYGAYSMCDLNSRLAWAFNAYASKNKGSQQACDFSGNATTQSPKAASSCSALVNQAGGTQGTGTPTGGANVGAAATSSKSAGDALAVPSFDIGLLKMGTYVAVAMAAGAGVVIM